MKKYICKLFGHKYNVHIDNDGHIILDCKRCGKTKISKFKLR